MYNSRPNLYLGFHGCDAAVCNKLVNNPTDVKMSSEKHDWLGNGFYVWENNYARALEWAEAKRNRDGKTVPAVLGVVYQLNYCLDLTDTEYIGILAAYYDALKKNFFRLNQELPKNKDTPKDKHHDLVLRELDCAVIEYMHDQIAERIKKDVSVKGFSAIKPFDTARGIFTEGGAAFEGAGIQAKNHIQVCIRNLNCIKGFFIPRSEIKFP